MNADEIRKLEANRETDALVAEGVMGWERRAYWLKGWHGSGRKTYSIEKTGLMGPNGVREVDRFPHFSTDIAAAWEVVGKMTPIKFGFNLAIESPPGPHGDWEVNFYNGGDHYVYGDTAPLAICRAALLAVMGDES